MADGYRIGVDIGGTFTDVVLLGSDGTLRTKKVLSTPDDYARGVVEGILELLQETGVAPASVTKVVHATTVASNAVLEGKGSSCCLLTTAGFRDVLEMRRLRIPVMYELQYEKPPPLVPRRLRYEIPERTGPRGEEWAELDEQAVRDAAERARAEGVTSVAISFLHAYANPAHERRAAEIVREVVGDDVYITCSSEILAEIREYERTSTAVVNAYVGPVVQRYIRSLESSLAEAGISAPLQIMQSSGGLMSAEAAIRKPAHLVESGPAAGVVACAFLARAAGIPNVISLDMGGTTAKAAILEDGLPVKTSEYEVGAGINLSSRLIKGGGYAIRLPFIDLSEIGAGGGSLVSVDEFGMLHVGPESAGADPGPACYGLGGDEPTLTDALVVLGYLNPEYLTGGDGRDRCRRGRARARGGGGAARPGCDRGRLRRLPARRRDDDESGQGGLDLPRPGSARLRALRLRRQRAGGRRRDRARAADAPRARAARARRLQRGRPAPVRDRARVRAHADGPRRERLVGGAARRLPRARGRGRARARRRRRVPRGDRPLPLRRHPLCRAGLRADDAGRGRCSRPRPDRGRLQRRAPPHLRARLGGRADRHRQPEADRAGDRERRRPVRPARRPSWSERRTSGRAAPTSGPSTGRSTSR